jgi:hypothetical protein
MKSKMTLVILASAFAFGSVTAEAHNLHHNRHYAAHRASEKGALRRVAEHRVSHRLSRNSDLQRVGRRFGTHIEAQARGWHRLGQQQSSGLRALVAHLAAVNGVPYSLANAVVTIESHYNPGATNRSGAMGLMQIKTQTARGLGFHGAPANLLDPNVNAQFGMRYLAVAYRQAGGNVCGTVMRYESGTAATHMSAENRAYCSRAFSLIKSR